METRTIYVLVSTTTGRRGVTSYDPQLLRGRITDRDTQAIVPWSQSGSLARIRRYVARAEAYAAECRAAEEQDADDLCPVAVTP